jgi:hypothetical protein
VKDTKLKWGLERAVRERDIWQAAKDAAPDAPFTWSDVAVQGVPHFAELRLGIHLIRSNEFGLYGSSWMMMAKLRELLPHGFEHSRVRCHSIH